jgi:hypothetical protein
MKIIKLNTILQTVAIIITIGIGILLVLSSCDTIDLSIVNKNDLYGEWTAKNELNELKYDYFFTTENNQDLMYTYDYSTDNILFNNIYRFEVKNNIITLKNQYTNTICKELPVYDYDYYNKVMIIIEENNKKYILTKQN